MRSIHLLLIAVFLFLFASRLVQDGMFIDGLTYAAIANNMAHGIGSFWEPKFSDMMNPVFFDQPPLQFGLQSVFFRILGDGYGTERIYGLIIIGFTVFLIARIWQSFFPDSKLKTWWPVPVLIWMLNKDTFLFYTSNMIECTMTIFDLLAVWLLLQKWPVNQQVSSKKSEWIYLSGAAILLVSAFMTKGPAGLFPLAFFVIYGISAGWSVGKIVRNTLILSMLFAAILSMFFLYEPSATGLKTYLEHQVLAALQGHRSQVADSNRLFIIGHFLLWYGPWLIAGAGLWYFLVRRAGKTMDAVYRQPLVFSSLTAASALLPIVLSPKQAPHYIVPALPWVALALGVWYYSVLKGVNFGKKIMMGLNIISWVLVLLSAVWVMDKTHQRLPEARVQLHDMEEMLRIIPAGETVAYQETKICFPLIGYFQRYNYSALDFNFEEHKYLIVPKTVSGGDAIPVYFKRATLNTDFYDLYIRR